MLRIIAIVLIYFASTVNCIGQKENNFFKLKKLQTAIKNGVIMGEGFTPYYSGQIVSGFNSGKWFGGLGAGVDYHNNMRSFPIFLEGAKYVHVNGYKAFFVADLGYNISAVTNGNNVRFAPNNLYKQKGGLYYEAGAGLQFGKKGKLKWGPSLSYSCRQSTESGNYYYSYFIDVFTPVASTEYVSNTYSFRRYILKINFWF